MSGRWIHVERLAVGGWCVWWQGRERDSKEWGEVQHGSRRMAAKRAALAELDARIRALRAARAELAKAPCGWGEVGDVRRLGLGDKPVQSVMASYLESVQPMEELGGCGPLTGGYCATLQAIIDDATQRLVNFSLCRADDDI